MTEEPHTTVPTPASPVVASAETEVAPEAPPAKERRPGSARLPWSLTALMTLVAVGFAVAWAPLYTQAKDRERVREAAEALVLHLTTFDGESIDEWVQETQRRATDTYAEEVNTLFDPQLRAALKEARAESVGRLVNLFVQDVDGDEAMVFAVVRQTITNARAPQPVEDELRMQIELRNEAGQWKAAKVEVLGPQGGGLVDEAPVVPEAEGS